VFPTFPDWKMQHIWQSSSAQALIANCALDHGSDVASKKGNNGRVTVFLEAHGRAATTEAPFAWLRMEPAPDNMARMELRLTLWPGGEERVLAEVHPHGAWVKWAECQGRIDARP